PALTGLPGAQTVTRGFDSSRGRRRVVEVSLLPPLPLQSRQPPGGTSWNVAPRAQYSVFAALAERTPEPAVIRTTARTQDARGRLARTLERRSCHGVTPEASALSIASSRSRIRASSSATVAVNC